MRAFAEATLALMEQLCSGWSCLWTVHLAQLVPGRCRPTGPVAACGGRGALQSAGALLKATALAVHMLLRCLAQSLRVHVAPCRCKACAGAGAAPVCSRSCGGLRWGAGHAVVAAGSRAGSSGAASYHNHAVRAELFSAACVQGVCASRAYERAQGSCPGSYHLSVLLAAVCMVVSLVLAMLCLLYQNLCAVAVWGDCGSECWVLQMLNTFCCM